MADDDLNSPQQFEFTADEEKAMRVANAAPRSQDWLQGSTGVGAAPPPRRRGKQELLS